MLLSVEDELVVVEIAEVAASNMRGSSRVPPWWSLCPQHDERVCVAVDGDFVADVANSDTQLNSFIPM